MTNKDKISLAIVLLSTVAFVVGLMNHSISMTVLAFVFILIGASSYRGTK